MNSLFSEARFVPNPVGITPFSKKGKPTILMCPPDYFTVAYAINPWMEEAHPCDVELAKRQWENLYKAITEQAGADVAILDPVKGLPDLVFTANAAFVYNDTAVIAHYKHEERRGEEPVCAEWFAKHGFNVVRMPDNIFFEGAGDALIWQDRVFAGYKTRTDIASHSLLTAATDLPVLSLELINPRYYHIDVCLCPLADGHLIYAPDSFDEYGRAVVEANVPADKLIPVSSEEAARFACNAVNVNDTVIFNQGSTRLAEDLKARGFHVVQVDLSEFLKSGGSSKCLTLRIG
jgi:N-dimethylarginine dimethylaminohydrolase